MNTTAGKTMKTSEMEIKKMIEALKDHGLKVVEVCENFLRY